MRQLLVLWIAATVLFIGLVLQGKTDVSTASNKDDWMQTNGPYGGDIFALYATPEGVLFAGTNGAGIFRSIDLGDSWTPVNTGLRDEPGEGYISIAAFAQKRNMLYAGTTGGLYESLNGGDTWHHVPTLQGYVSISGVVTIGARVYIGTLQDGVWYSDDGDSWMPMNDGLGHPLIRELLRIGTTLVAGTADGAFRKRVNENSWTPINAGFVAQPIDMELINRARIESGLDGPLPPQFPSGIRVDSFAAMENLLYIGILMDGEGGLFRSDDEGDTWTRITAEDMVHTAEALATSGTTLYASTFGGGVFRSKDRGDSWTVVNNGLTHQVVSALLAVSKDTVFVGTMDGGVFRTTDGGNSWVEVNTGLMNTSVSELEVIGKTIYARIGHRLVYSVDSGESWQPVNIPSLPIQYHFAALSVAYGELYIAATRFAPSNQGGVVGGIFRLDTENNSLVELITDSELYGIECMEIVGTTFYVGTQGEGVFRWDGTDSWTSLGLEGHFITALSVNKRRVYAGAWHGKIFRLEGAGKPWKLINSTEMVGSSIMDLRWIGSTLYATTWRKGVFRSTNDGNSWTQLNDGLGKPSIMTMKADGAEHYVGTYYNGVFQWIEDKKWWKPIGSLRRRVDSLAVLDGFLYAGTWGGGVLRIPIKQ